MKPLPLTPELLAVARRVVWFKEPTQALADPILFLSHVMTYGTAQDLAALRGLIDKQDFSELLAHAPPGVFDRRSWAYWNLICGREPPLPMPQRHFT